MKKYFLITITLALGMVGLQAQNVDDAKRHLYYGRTSSAISTLNQMISADGNNAEAIYWLGQAHLRNDEVKKARELYQNAVQRGINSPLLQVGVGHVNMLEGNTAGARQLFEEAIATSTKRRKEDPVILQAIGRANADGASTVGDPAYGIATLQRAASINPNDAETFVNMGISFLKLGSDKGGDAYEAFMNALKVDPNYAAAKYRLGKLFLTQNNKERFEGYFIGATESDPKYAPAYLELYNYYAQRDVNKAKTYLENYMSNSDKDCNVDFFYADYLFRAGKYQESVDIANAMLNGACKELPRLPVLFAYNYDRLGDTAKARESIENYLSTAAADKVQPDDYLLAATVLKKMPGREDAAIKYLQVALEKDTLRANQVMFMDTIASLFKKKGEFDNRLLWLQKSYALNPNPSNLDIYNIGEAAYQVGNLTLADSMFSAYATKYPDQIYGHLGVAKTAIAKDKDTTIGSAVPAVKNLIQVLEKIDVAKNKSLILQHYGYLVYVHANVFKDYPAALLELEGLLKIDPDNSYAKQTAEQIKKVMAGSRQTSKKKP